MLFPIFDLDGTLLDSDRALIQPFLELGVAAADISFGHVVGEECARLGIDLEAYIARYDTEAARPFDGVVHLLDGLDGWAVCSNKHPISGRAELARLGWEPDVALFTDAFDGPKRLDPVLDLIGRAAHECVFVGDTAHDRSCALDAGITFALAGWNPRAVAEPGDVCLRRPAELVALLAAT